MEKSMYSLILSDEVIDRIDSIAKLRGQSRSSLIDQILAQYLSVITPEQRMKNIYELMQEQMEQFRNEFRFMLGQGDKDFTAVSALKYKYNPTIRYNVILYRDDREHIGELRATLRTQNAVLLEEFTEFVRLWDRIERSVAGTTPEASLKGGAYRRLIRRQGSGADAQAVSKAITDYITMFNDCVKLYLSSDDDTQAVIGQITQKYIGYCERGVLL